MIVHKEHIEILEASGKFNAAEIRLAKWRCRMLDPFYTYLFNAINAGTPDQRNFLRIGCNPYVEAYISWRDGDLEKRWAAVIAAPVKGATSCRL